ncbi:hypothetical protein L226DRAFT_572064 [Lentinus tigrinus ALCF2SS1-7]|uniref:uncharacterized protein n=1 Tax=Lentinus tigrinus ALCF2SS1-7 TaxID=1328758 RepID=UPI001165EBFC|nr:hypothetical protein L226DRAFT_572064 [Lentinus tigrinus ALCF2SS1-7]
MLELPIIKALHSDGLGFLQGITLFRILNLTFAAISRPSLTFFVALYVLFHSSTPHVAHPVSSLLSVARILPS